MMPNDRLFSITKSYLEKEMIRGVELSGVKKIRLHNLRHSHASLLISKLEAQPNLVADRYSNIVVVGKKENVQRIVDSLQEMQEVMREIAGQIQSGDFPLSEESYQELKRDYLALVITIVDIVDGAEYLFSKESLTMRRSWKSELELEQYRHVLELDVEREDAIEKEE